MAIERIDSGHNENLFICSFDCTHVVIGVTFNRTILPALRLRELKIGEHGTSPGPRDDIYWCTSQDECRERIIAINCIYHLEPVVSSKLQHPQAHHNAFPLAPQKYPLHPTISSPPPFHLFGLLMRRLIKRALGVTLQILQLLLASIGRLVVRVDALVVGLVGGGCLLLGARLALRVGGLTALLGCGHFGVYGRGVCRWFGSEGWVRLLVLRRWGLGSVIGVDLLLEDRFCFGLFWFGLVW